ncbi:MACPF domain-containing protein [Sesamum angolense]|uniref:MACPF domain-containing protein n=1 Tax=Sesamum angolense TaxID=2727404 RepID=A0AAE1WI03_9LAMI|nr:MACPF domain-containing protein [Sesamum angolense]
MADNEGGGEKETALRLRAAEEAVQCIGLGYDLTMDLSLNYCKKQQTSKDGSRLIAVDFDHVRNIAFPGGIVVQDVPKSISCDKGERMRFSSDVLSFLQYFLLEIRCKTKEILDNLSESYWEMSELFNQELSLSGKIPTGHFNAAFEFTGCWQKDAAFTKSLAFDGVFISLYSIALEKSQVMLQDHIKQAVPSSWDPAALASWLRYGLLKTDLEYFSSGVLFPTYPSVQGTVRAFVTNLTAPFSIKYLVTPTDGDVIDFYFCCAIKSVSLVAENRAARESEKWGERTLYVKQEHSSPLKPIEIQKRLKDVADKKFSDHESNERGYEFLDPSTPSSHYNEEEVTFLWGRIGGSNDSMTHNKWCQTVQLEPELINVFRSNSSLLTGVGGSGMLGHAINLYLRYKPPIEALRHFLGFQLPKQWAPLYGDVPNGPDRKQQGVATLQFSLMGSKLYVNTDKNQILSVYDCCRAGMKESKFQSPLSIYHMKIGRRSNLLAVHLQHLSSLPESFQLHTDSGGRNNHSYDIRYYEKVQWKNFSHVCTAPVESDDDLSIVTGAQLKVKQFGMRNVLFIRLHFSKLIGATVVKQPEWDGSPALAQKSGILATLVSFTNGQKPPPKPYNIDINSAVYPSGPPIPTPTLKLLRFVDTTEMTRGPQDSPGHWVVSGASLVVDKGKISLRLKYSLLAVILQDEEVLLQG